MQATITPSVISGNITAPASKSAMQRACAAALIKKGKSIISNTGCSNDDKAALSIIQALGAKILSHKEDEIVIESNGINPVNGSINCEESGLSVRMFTSLAALSADPIAIYGQGSLLSRPMSFFDTILPKLGVDVYSNNGHLPLQIQGPLTPVDIEIDGSLSSQFLTGLLFAYAAAEASGVTISVNDLKSTPYVNLTLKIMKEFGLKVPQYHDYGSFYFSAEKHKQSTAPIHYTVEGDWSNAAFLLVAGCIAGNLTIKGLDITSKQADKAILDVLEECNANVIIRRGQLSVKETQSLSPFYFDATDYPDLFPPLVALAAYCKGDSIIVGVNRLLHKESNRAKKLQEVFEKMGVSITVADNIMMIKGGSVINGATIHSCNDHRIAMACAVAALKAKGKTIIDNAEAVNKSYPNFFSDLRKIGVQAELKEQTIVHHKSLGREAVRG